MKNNNQPFAITRVCKQYVKYVKPLPLLLDDNEEHYGGEDDQHDHYGNHNDSCGDLGLGGRTGALTVLGLTPWATEARRTPGYARET